MRLLKLLSGVLAIAAMGALQSCQTSKEIATAELKATGAAQSADTTVESAAVVLALMTQQEAAQWEIVTREAVQSAESSVTASLTNLLELPEGAVYTNRNGRASVRLTRAGENIIATGGCDSLEREVTRLGVSMYKESQRCDSLERELKHKTSEAETYKDYAQNLYESVKENRSNSIRAVVKWLSIGVVSGGVLTFLSMKKWQS